MKKALINNRLYDVVDKEEYYVNHDIYNPRFTAIQTHGHVYPVKNKTDSGVGIYYQNNSPICKVVKPELKDKSYNESIIIDNSNCKTVEEIIKKDNLVRNIENEILATKDNIFSLNVGPDDTPEMKAMKEAINLKQVDIKQYENRFDQFQNDIRLLKGKSITLAKLISTCNNFDISAELTLRDREGCANPMNTEIKINLTEGRD